MTACETMTPAEREAHIAQLKRKLADLNAGKFEWPTLASLDGAPVVGGYYRVPTIRHAFYGLEADWPVRGPQHQELPFGILDWHLDRRFFLPYQEDHCAKLDEELQRNRGTGPDPGPERRWPGSRSSAYLTFMWIEPGVAWPGWPAGLALTPGSAGVHRGTPPPSRLKDLRCTRPTVEPEPLTPLWPELQETYGDPAEPIRSSEGRPLCPHMKVDLTGEPCDADGVVVCPLHRLRVKVRPRSKG